MLNKAGIVPIALSEALVEVTSSQVACHRYAAGNCQSIALPTGLASKSDYATLKMSKRRRDRVTLMRGTDHDEASGASRVSDTERERYHAPVRRAYHGVHCANASLVEGSGKNVRLIVSRNGRRTRSRSGIINPKH